VLRIVKADRLRDFENGQLAIFEQTFALFYAQSKHIFIWARIHVHAELMQEMRGTQLGDCRDVF